MPSNAGSAQRADSPRQAAEIKAAKHCPETARAGPGSQRLPLGDAWNWGHSSSWTASPRGRNTSVCSLGLNINEIFKNIQWKPFFSHQRPPAQGCKGTAAATLQGYSSAVVSHSSACPSDDPTASWHWSGHTAQWQRAHPVCVPAANPESRGPAMLSPLPGSLSGYTIRAGVDTAMQTSLLTPPGTRWARGRRTGWGILQNRSCHIYLGLLQSRVEASGRAHKRTIQGNPAAETKQMLWGSLQRPQHRRLAKLLSQIRAHLLGSIRSPGAALCQWHCWEEMQSGGQSLAGNGDAE